MRSLAGSVSFVLYLSMLSSSKAFGFSVRSERIIHEAIHLFLYYSKPSRLSTFLALPRVLTKFINFSFY
uniref:Secreted protein n=1 Tax=Setaria viridis TaxID=4556 RepID=A0A4U6VRX0_SETVI|nr:hypothetical protein SEVIR_2G178050v2 [Setaria viridis]